jgi:tetratricopeptide (TPR) repeat protein
VLQQASVFHGGSRELASEYGRLALEFDQIGVAGKLLAAADDPANPDWRIISARGTVLAKQGKYKDAIPFYESSLALAPDHPSILSNLALAHAMNGEPKRAEAMLRQAATTDRNSLKIRQNLALVLGLQGKYDEGKLLASNDLSAENATENAEYLRRVVKLEPERPAAAERSVARANADAQEAQFETEIESEAEFDSAPERKPVATSKRSTKPKDAKTTAQASSVLRGTMNDAADRKPAGKQEEEPGFDTTFSVAQWSPQTEPAALEIGTEEQLDSAAAQLPQGK